MARFIDRRDAGRALAVRLSGYARRPDVLVLALPRGGVPVAFEVARAIEAPLDVFVVRKLGVPGREELAMGAIASGRVRVLNRRVVDALGIGEDVVDAVAARERRELERREARYRQGRPAPEIAHRTVIVVDDGLATGSTMRAALAALRAQEPAGLVVAVPVAAQRTCDELAGESAAVVCVMAPEDFRAVAQWYADFAAPSDEDIAALLEAARRWAPPVAPSRASGSTTEKARPAPE